MPNPQQSFPLDGGDVPDDFASALRGMADRPFLASRNWQKQQERAERDGAHPDLLEFERLLIRRMAKIGVPMFAAEVLRSQERQNDLYALGVTKAKAGQGPHPYGCAADVVHSVRGWDLSRKQWSLIGHVGQELARQNGLKIEWGGNWKFYDPSHWQVIGWKEQKENFPWPMK